MQLGTWSGWVGKDQKPATIYMLTKSERDEEGKGKIKEEKAWMSLTLLRIPRYALVNCRTPATVKPLSAVSHSPPRHPGQVSNHTSHQLN